MKFDILDEWVKEKAEEEGGCEIGAGVVLCDDCLENSADLPSRLCPGCDAYRDHTGQF